MEGTALSSDRWLVFLTFFLSLLVFTGIGALAGLRKKSTTSDYLLAGRGVPPWLVALSAVATLSSGFMFVGQIGLTYRVGLASMWWLIGWTIGDLLAWLFLYERLRRTSEERGELSALALLEPRSPRRRVVVPLAGLLTVFYLAMYAAAQLKAGSTALQSIFGMPESLGAIIGAVVVVIYCYAGGIRASIWTDGAQSLVMFGSMALLTVVATSHIGGVSALMADLAAIDPVLTSPMPDDPRLGFAIYFAGMVFGGFGVVGQPHILVRSMSIADAAQIRRARLYYFLWLVPFYVMAILVGLCARVLLPELANAGSPLASEQALPLLSIDLLPDLLVGLMLAGLFSATMSTADSQIIACTSAVTQDIQPRWAGSYNASKLSTLGVTAVALTIALSSGSGVFTLVLDAWAVLSCTLGPLIVLRLFRLPCSQGLGVAMIAVGFAVTHVWTASGYAGATYVNFPGMVAAFSVYFGALAFRKLRSSYRESAREGGV